MSYINYASKVDDGILTKMETREARDRAIIYDYITFVRRDSRMDENYLSVMSDAEPHDSRVNRCG